MSQIVLSATVYALYKYVAPLSKKDGRLGPVGKFL